MTKIYTETDTSYIPEEDITIIWQNMYKYVEGEGDTHIQHQCYLNDCKLCGLRELTEQCPCRTVGAQNTRHAA